MVLGVGVVFAAYLGVRFFEVTEKRPFNKKLRRLSKRVSQKKRAPHWGVNLRPAMRRPLAINAMLP